MFLETTGLIILHFYFVGNAIGKLKMKDIIFSIPGLKIKEVMYE